jgi:hypothetical protein
MNEPTHIILEYKSQDSEILYRASDGIAIAQRKKTVVLSGDDPNKKQSRVFLDSEYAGRYIRETLPRRDAEELAMESAAEVEIRDGEPIIQLPDNAVEIPGGVRRFN